VVLTCLIFHASTSAKLSLNREVVSLMTILNNAVETVSDDAAAKQIEIRIQFDTPEEVIFVDADPLRLEQVFWNLLNNAVKFTPAGGSVHDSCKQWGWPRYVDCGGQCPGIEPEFLPHVLRCSGRPTPAAAGRTVAWALPGVGASVDRTSWRYGCRRVRYGSGRKVHDRASCTRETESPWGLRLRWKLEPSVRCGSCRRRFFRPVDMLPAFEMDGAFGHTARGRS